MVLACEASASIYLASESDTAMTGGENDEAEEILMPKDGRDR
jgi:hypothetical protein